MATFDRPVLVISGSAKRQWVPEDPDSEDAYTVDDVLDAVGLSSTDTRVSMNGRVVRDPSDTQVTPGANIVLTEDKTGGR